MGVENQNSRYIASFYYVWMLRLALHFIAQYIIEFTFKIFLPLNYKALHGLCNNIRMNYSNLVKDSARAILQPELGCH